MGRSYIATWPPLGMWARWYGPIVQEFRAWAEEEPAVRAALIVGSQARSKEPADEWSDLDLVIFHDAPEQLIASTEWVGRFGTVVLTVVEPTAVLDSRERRVLYSDGRDVDFAVFSSKGLGLVTKSPEGLAVLARGYEILVDKDQQLTTLRDALGNRPPERLPLPTEEQFQAAVADFWYHVLWAAKKLRRGELWTAKLGCDGYLKLALLRMIEWRTIARHGREANVWHAGRFLERWTDPDVRARLPATFSSYRLVDMVRGLGETARLYSELARELAKARNWVYPLAAEARVLELMSNVLKGTTAGA